MSEQDFDLNRRALLKAAVALVPGCALLTRTTRSTTLTTRGPMLGLMHTHPDWSSIDWGYTSYKTAAELDRDE